ncbi:MAG TPA: serine hydrolase domain-containing protein [Cellvibrio sp.]|nr:serine hydrolase domain-containing protein [Cellvibrio sp.]
MRSIKSSNPTNWAVLAGGLAVALIFAAPLTQANEKRVTVPIALPFQQAGSSASSAATGQEAAVHAVQPMAFTQSPTVVSAVAVSSAAQVATAIPDATAPSVASAATPLATGAVAGTVDHPAVADGTVAAAGAAVALVAGTGAAPQPPVNVQGNVQSNVQSNVQASSPATEAAALDQAAAFKASMELADSEQEGAQPTQTIPLVTTAPIKAPRYPVGHPEAFVPEFEDYIAKKVAPFVPGVAVVIVSGGQIKSLNGYGVRRAGTRETVTPDTVFRLASLSKSFAATAASVLVNEGKISWDTTITSVLPKVAFKNSAYGKKLTLRHALSQSSGLPRHTYSHYIDENMSYADIVARLRFVNFACAPGKCFAYQNVVYSLAGDMIKKKSGMSFEQYAEQKILAPLGMRSASYGLANYNASPNRAAPHINGGKRWIPTSVNANWYRVPPAAGVNASIVDMSRFLLAQMGKRPDVLPLSVLNPIQARVTKNTPAQNYYSGHKAAGNTAYGMGWRVFDYGRNKNFIHHGGHVKGFRTEMVFNRDLQIGMVFLTNSETRLARDVIFKFLDSYERAQAAARAAKKKK